VTARLGHIGSRKASAVSLFQTDLPFTNSAPILARRSAKRFAHDNRLIGDVEALLLIVSELVANAVVHGRPPISMVLTCRAQRVVIGVSDGDVDTDRVTVRSVEARRLGGRGLRIVDALAAEWGTRVMMTGKCVWAAVAM
jgi:anti-sigma regulatory factor (Ser/Thr protein kinase)